MACKGALFYMQIAYVMLILSSCLEHCMTDTNNLIRNKHNLTEI